MRRTLPAVIGLLSLLMGLLVAPSAHAVDATETLAPQSAHGITVLDTRQVRDRVWEVDIASRHVGPHTHKGKLQVRVVLPANYFESRTKHKRYPVQYLLHGQGGRSSDWTEQSRVVDYTADKDVIVVTPEGGAGGWYTDWVDQRQGKQNLEEFHVHQLVPFIDANFRTIATKQGRAISGFSMGGFGAMHYAGRHPHLFAYASSFSGGLDLDNPAIRIAVEASAALNDLYPLNGAFGTAVRGLDDNWKRHNPVRMASNFSTVEVSLYAGNGLKPGLDIIEIGSRDATVAFDKALTRAGVPHYTNYYGNPGTLNGESCLGDHTWTCASGAYKEDLGRMMAAFSHQ